MTVSADVSVVDITHLCSCGKSRDQKSLSQRWKLWGEGPKSCVSAAASLSVSGVLTCCSLNELSDLRMRSESRRCTLSASLFQRTVCCRCRNQAGCFLSGWTSLSCRLSGLLQLTRLGLWMLQAAPAPCIPLWWREGTERTSHTHSPQAQHLYFSLTFFLHVTLIL